MPRRKCGFNSRQALFFQTRACAAVSGAGVICAACGKAWESAGFGYRRPSVQIRPRRLGYCGGARVGTGGRLLNVITQVRFLPPQLVVPLAEWLKAPVLQTGQAGSIPAGHFVVRRRQDRGSANGRLPGFEPGGGGSNPSPRASHPICSGAVAVGSDAWL